MKSFLPLCGALLALLLPATGEAKVDVAMDGACGFKITFNLQFYGAGGDSAFAKKVRDQVINCWKDHKVDCCPVTIDVLYKIGGARTAGYDSIYVYNDPAGAAHEDDHVSCCQIGGVNGTDHYGVWDTNEPPETYAHEVGHLAGLPDTYKEEEKAKVVDGKIVKFRVTKPCVNHEKDKMATLSGKVPQETIEALIKAAGLSCPKTCWPADANGAKADAAGTAEPAGPQKRPSEGTSQLHFNWSPSGSVLRFYRSPLTGGDSLFVPVINGFVTIQTDTIPPANVNPLWNQTMAGIVFTDFQMLLPSFEWAPGQFTGVNQLQLLPATTTPLMEIYAQNGHVNDLTGQFSGFLPLQLINLINSPADPYLLLSTVDGSIDWLTGAIHASIDLSPLLHYSTVAGVPGVPDAGGDSPLRLAHNAPNPFHDQTSLRFSMDRPGSVSVRIFDLNGRLIRVVTDGLRTAGQQEVMWDGRDGRGQAVASGVYFYAVTGFGRTQTSRVVLLR